MTKKMLIDASHAEETRVVVLDGNRLEDFDVETANRKQIKGNIYLAKVIRVEPSLQAAFVEYGGNRHGFLAFGEIHPDYYQIPVADRKRLLAQQAADAAEEEARAETEVTPATAAQPLEIKPIEILAAPPPDDVADGSASEDNSAGAPAEMTASPDEDFEGAAPAYDAPAETVPVAFDETPAAPGEGGEIIEVETEQNGPASPAPESMGGDGDDAAEARERRQREKFVKNYKIQDVIHRRQIMLIQVVKEERGNKGAALTTYLSLAGRFSVLMPNSPSGGGVSRKITSVADRRRLKEAMAELDVPDGMGLIVRTAGANRPKPEITRDCEYLLRLWDDIRERTMESTAPALIYEEASLIKRTIRDVYTRDIEEVLVDGEEGFRAARDFMSMLMPAHAKKVQLWTEGQPLFAKHQVEAQLDAMLNPTVQLRSGGYIVINQTEALVAIDVNSGRSTRERSIEDTALRTNMEAAEEAAKQLRMRDLAGLIVIDFIDMESRKNNASVERKLKDSLKNDRARIQVGSISHFGLMEMSRQRLRPSLAEASMVTCPHCAGMGHVRSPESAALHILRAIEDEGGKFRAAEIAVFLPAEIAFYLFNHKRERLAAIEARYAMRVIFNPDASMTGTNFRIEKIKAQTVTAPVAPLASYAPVTPERVLERQATVTADEPEAEADGDEGDAGDAPNATDTPEEGERKRRRRRRRGKRRSDGAVETPVVSADEAAPAEPVPASDVVEDQPNAFDLVLAAELAEPGEAGVVTEEPVRRRRARGGRRRAKGDDESVAVEAAPELPIYTDIADIFEAAERAEALALSARVAARQALDAQPTPPEPEAPAAEPPVASEETPIPPKAVEPEAPPVEKKRGWWRR
jgi:ribonuclease E